MIKLIINQYNFNLVYAKKLVEDLSNEQMTKTPAAGFENHAAFTLGHLATGSAMMAEDLGGIYEVPDGWKELFQRSGPGDPRRPSKNIELFPEKNILIKELESQHEKVKRILLSIDENKLTELVKWRFNNFMPTLLDLTLFMCVNHEAMHLGQLAGWRRALGLDSALAKI